MSLGCCRQPLLRTAMYVQGEEGTYGKSTGTVRLLLWTTLAVNDSSFCQHARFLPAPVTPRKGPQGW